MLITGTRSGLGRYLCEYYVKHDYFVVGCSRQSVDFELDNYRHYCLDINDERAVRRMMRDIQGLRQRLDVLVNNAAVNTALGPILLVPYASALKTIETNVLGTFVMTREAARLMRKTPHGRIINVGSMAARHEVEGDALYAASKAAVTTLTRVMAKELYPLGITCNVVAPSALATGLTEALRPDALGAVLKRNAIPEMGTMADASHTIDWLIRPESQGITGQVIYLGGA